MVRHSIIHSCFFHSPLLVCSWSQRWQTKSTQTPHAHTIFRSYCVLEQCENAFLFKKITTRDPSCQVVNLYKTSHMHVNYPLFSSFQALFLLCVKLFYLPPFPRSSRCLCALAVTRRSLACSLERKMLPLQAAGVRCSTWCLTGSHTGSARDESSFVPVAGSHGRCASSRDPPTSYQGNCRILHGET